MSSDELLTRLSRMRLHMAEAAWLRTMRGRDKWTKYPKSPAQFRSIGGFLVLSEPSTTIGLNQSNFSLTMKNTLEPTCSLKPDTEA